MLKKKARSGASYLPAVFRTIKQKVDLALVAGLSFGVAASAVTFGLGAALLCTGLSIILTNIVGGDDESA